LIALLLMAAVTDGLHRRIPNALVAAGAVSALASQALLPAGVHPLHGSMPGTPGVVSGLASAVLMLALGVALWRMSVIGAGDAKWLAVTAAHAGPQWLPTQLLLTALAGGLLALVWLALRRRDALPYAVAIAGGQFALMAHMALMSPTNPSTLQP